MRRRGDGIIVGGNGVLKYSDDRPDIKAARLLLHLQTAAAICHRSFSTSRNLAWQNRRLGLGLNARVSCNIPAWRRQWGCCASCCHFKGQVIAEGCDAVLVPPRRYGPWVVSRWIGGESRCPVTVTTACRCRFSSFDGRIRPLGCRGYCWDGSASDSGLADGSKGSPAIDITFTRRYDKAVRCPRGPMHRQLTTG
jgi:hypothetical protein